MRNVYLLGWMRNRCVNEQTFRIYPRRWMYFASIFLSIFLCRICIFRHSKLGMFPYALLSDVCVLEATQSQNTIKKIIFYTFMYARAYARIIVIVCWLLKITSNGLLKITIVIWRLLHIHVRSFSCIIFVHIRTQNRKIWRAISVAAENWSQNAGWGTRYWASFQ